MTLNLGALSLFIGKQIVIIGDIMIDEYVQGRVRRISPEAPVPILEFVERHYRLGGAANAAANVNSLGGDAHLIGVVGQDNDADLLARIADGARLAATLVPDARPTTRKTRYSARGQQIMRLDIEERSPISSNAKKCVIDAAIRKIVNADACIISDYGKGVVSDDLVAEIVSLASSQKIPIIADPKHRDFRKYRGVSVITPNSTELETAYGAPIRSTDELDKAGRKLLEVLGGAALASTRGAEGMVLFEPGREPVRVRPHARTIFDVTGAGDTVVATLAMSLAAGLPLRDGIVLASLAAGVSVSRAGTVAVTTEELETAMRQELQEEGGRLEVSVLPRDARIDVSILPRRDSYRTT